MKPTANANVLAFDFGTQRIGVAVGNTLIRFAQPLVTIAADPATMMAMIGALVNEWQPHELVVGLPLHADGAPHAMTAKAKRFANDLGTRFHLPITLVDERWTTELAQDERLALVRIFVRERDGARQAALEHVPGLRVVIHEEHASGVELPRRVREGRRVDESAVDEP